MNGPRGEINSASSWNPQRERERKRERERERERYIYRESVISKLK
jgi:hypothetical protein